MPKKPRGKPPSQRPGHLPGGAHRQRPLKIDGFTIDAAFKQAVSPKSPEPAVLVINADDELGGKLGREIVGARIVADVAEDFRHTHYATTLNLGVGSAESAGDILSDYFENAAADLKTPMPPEHYRVVVVDHGEMTCLFRPIPRYEIVVENNIRSNP
jgi:hypothetical protein